MKFKFKLTLPLGKDGRVRAETECGASSSEWKARLSELSAQTAEAAAQGFPRDVAGHPGGLANALIDDFISKL